MGIFNLDVLDKSVRIEFMQDSQIKTLFGVVNYQLYTYYKELEKQMINEGRYDKEGDFYIKLSQKTLNMKDKLFKSFLDDTSYQLLNNIETSKKKALYEHVESEMVDAINLFENEVFDKEDEEDVTKVDSEGLE